MKSVKQSFLRNNFQAKESNFPSRTVRSGGTVHQVVYDNHNITYILYLNNQEIFGNLRASLS